MNARELIEATVSLIVQPGPAEEIKASIVMDKMHGPVLNFRFLYKDLWGQIGFTSEVDVLNLTKEEFVRRLRNDIKIAVREPAHAN